ncbi:hypothetical protein A2U01_0055582, partial [Trifolium medium]|nr:hypothetical protein [Trifolium medium]
SSCSCCAPGAEGDVRSDVSQWTCCGSCGDMIRSCFCCCAPGRDVENANGDGNADGRDPGPDVDNANGDGDADGRDPCDYVL